MERIVFLLVLLCGFSYALPKIRKVEDPVENQYIVVLRVRMMTVVNDSFKALFCVIMIALCVINNENEEQK